MGATCAVFLRWHLPRRRPLRTMMGAVKGLDPGGIDTMMKECRPKRD
jgi:hypothetical protein